MMSDPVWLQGYFLGSYLFLAIVFSLPVSMGAAALALGLPVRLRASPRNCLRAAIMAMMAAPICVHEHGSSSSSWQQPLRAALCAVYGDGGPGGPCATGHGLRAAGQDWRCAGELCCSLNCNGCWHGLALTQYDALQIIVICFMAVTSSGASEMVAVSSLFTYDVSLSHC